MRSPARQRCALYLGNNYTGTAGLDGNLADVRFFRQVLSTDQVHALFSQAEQPARPGSSRRGRPLALGRRHRHDGLGRGAQQHGAGVAGHLRQRRGRRRRAVDRGAGLLRRSDYYATDYQYDWRDRQTACLQPDQVATIEKLDDAGNATKTQVFASASYTFDSGSPTGSISTQPGSLRRRPHAVRQPRPAVQFEVYKVNLVRRNRRLVDHRTWYDAAGNIVKTQTGTTGASRSSPTIPWETGRTATGFYTGSAARAGGRDQLDAGDQRQWAAAGVVNDNNVILSRLKPGTMPPTRRSPRPPTSNSSARA